jgi:probable rRNA maturation factor
MLKLEVEGQISCKARCKKLNKAWWQTNANKLALIALQTQTLLPLAPNKICKVVYSLQIVNDEEIQSLNKTFRGINKVTDVLSFPALNTEMLGMVVLPELELGDIVISKNKILEQANNFGHSIEREAAFLFVHGFLHLLGYDHEELNQEKEMFELQNSVLRAAQFER